MAREMKVTRASAVESERKAVGGTAAQQRAAAKAYQQNPKLRKKAK